MHQCIHLEVRQMHEPWNRGSECSKNRVDLYLLVAKIVQLLWCVWQTIII
jgi:hypothetical protein